MPKKGKETTKTVNGGGMSFSQILKGGAPQEPEMASFPDPTKDALQAAEVQLQRERREDFETGAVLTAAQTLTACDIFGINPTQRDQLEREAMMAGEEPIAQTPKKKGPGRPRKQSTDGSSSSSSSTSHKGMSSEVAACIPSSVSTRQWLRIARYWQHFGKRLHAAGITPLRGQQTDYSLTDLQQYERACELAVSDFDEAKVLGEQAIPWVGKMIYKGCVEFADVHPMIMMGALMTRYLSADLLAAYKLDEEYRDAVNLVSIQFAGLVKGNVWLKFAWALVGVITDPDRQHGRADVIAQENTPVVLSPEEAERKKKEFMERQSRRKNGGQ